MFQSPWCYCRACPMSASRALRPWPTQMLTLSTLGMAGWAETSSFVVMRHDMKLAGKHHPMQQQEQLTLSSARACLKAYVHWLTETSQQPSMSQLGTITISISQKEKLTMPSIQGQGDIYKQLGASGMGEVWERSPGQGADHRRRDGHLLPLFTFQGKCSQKSINE